MKKVVLLSMLSIAFIVTGCSKQNTVELGDTVTIIYTGTLENGSPFEHKETTITAGSGEVIQGIDQAIINMKKGKIKNIHIAPNLGYAGQYLINNIQRVPKLIFDKLGIATNSGDKVTLGTLSGIIRGNEKDNKGYDVVLFDINPEQTRNTTNYEIMIKNIKKATQTTTGYTL